MSEGKFKLQGGIEEIPDRINGSGTLLTVYRIENPENK